MLLCVRPPSTSTVLCATAGEHISTPTTTHVKGDT